MLSVLLVVYITCSAVTVCSSVLSGHVSRVDALVQVVDVCTIDVASAFMVLTGFLSTHAYKKSIQDPLEFQNLVMFMMIDVWASTMLACMIGSLYLISVHRFAAVHLPLTIFEGLTTVRQLEVSQAPRAAHTLNVFGLLVMCIPILLLCGPYSLMLMQKLHSTYSQVGRYVPVAASVSAITTISILSSVDSSSNLFYVSASSVSYRMLEFNLGSSIFHLLHVAIGHAHSVLATVKRFSLWVVVFFLVLWWSRFGAPWEVQEDTTCRRTQPSWIDQITPLLVLMLPLLLSAVVYAHNTRLKPTLLVETAGICAGSLALVRSLFARASSGLSRLRSETPPATAQTSAAD